MSGSDKNPVFVEAGRRGALKRWGGPPRTVRLDALTPDQRRLVLALVDAARAQTQEGPAAVGTPAGPEPEDGRASDRPAA